ncbi:hypothetical protein [Porcipelethomonas sp.]|uniref:hypothetical protein n=1 Tax=Porcipelethomonas sp. TaxID=2981675 RepID=UPI003EF3F93A
MSSYIYILVCQTGTKVAKILKMFTRKPYNHVSVSADPCLDEMYSFCRNNPSRPLPATFNREVVGKGTLGKFNNIPCEVYRLPVTKKQKQLFENNIEYFKNNREYFSYNCIGLGLIFFHIAYKRKNKFVCSQFVGYIMEKSGIKLDIPKPFCLYTPEDFRHIGFAKLVYQGELNKFYSGVREYQRLNLIDKGVHTA